MMVISMIPIQLNTNIHSCYFSFIKTSIYLLSFTCKQIYFHLKSSEQIKDENLKNYKLYYYRSKMIASYVIK